MADEHLLDMTAARAGITLSRLKIIENVQARKPNTSIILPTRYGKSDVIRVMSYELYHRDEVATTVVVSPSIQLMEQIIDSKKREKTRQRYNFQRPFVVRDVRKLTGDIAPDGEMLVSTTTQLMQMNLWAFCQWIEFKQHTTGKPVLIFWDECHQESDRNEWGKAIPACGEAGAISVLLTATPFRSQQEKIAGFEYVTLGDYKEERKYSKRIGETEHTYRYLTSEYEETHTTVALIPDVCVLRKPGVSRLPHAYAGSIAWQ